MLKTQNLKNLSATYYEKVHRHWSLACFSKEAENYKLPSLEIFWRNNGIVFNINFELLCWIGIYCQNGLFKIKYNGISMVFINSKYNQSNTGVTCSMKSLCDIIFTTYNYYTHLFTQAFNVVQIKIIGILKNI